jgi:molybdopterin-guanine dinucleotide biosynthesis protein A
VLAGGEGRRLGGRDKALVDFGGRTLLEITVERLAELTPDIVVACGQGPRPGWPRIAARMEVDRISARGPLAGLDAGLRSIANDRAVVVACDMPFLDPPLLRYIAGRLEGHDAAVPMLDGRYHPLHAAYSKRCLRHVEDLLLAGGSARDLLAAVDTVVVAEDEVRALDPAGLSCFNLNSPEDLAMARTIWPSRQAAADSGESC